MDLYSAVRVLRAVLGHVGNGDDNGQALINNATQPDNALCAAGVGMVWKRFHPRKRRLAVERDRVSLGLGGAERVRGREDRAGLRPENRRADRGSHLNSSTGDFAVNCQGRNEVYVVALDPSTYQGQI